MNATLRIILASVLITMSHSDPSGDLYNPQYTPPDYRGYFRLCVKNMKWGETSTDSIETRLVYQVNNDYKFTDWVSLGNRFGIEAKGKCVEFTNFKDYSEYSWSYIDLHTCSDDGLAINKIQYFNEECGYAQFFCDVPSWDRSAFTAEQCVKSDYIWLKGSADCYALSVNIQTGEVLMNPWMTGSGQECTKYEAHNNPLSLIEDDDGGMRIGIDENMMIFGGILVILIVISTCYSVYLCNTKYNKQYKMVRVYSDTDQENVQ